MKFYDITDTPVKIYGLAVVDKEKRRFWKLTSDIMEVLPQYEFLGRRCCGGRVRFKTNAKEMTVRMTVAQTKEDINIPLSGSAGADVYLGKGMESRYIGYVAPAEHRMEEISAEKVFCLTGRMESVTINLPRNEQLLSMEIGIEDDAELAAPEEYSQPGTVVYYGSSITEGGCAPRAGCAYSSIVSRWLDTDYLNMGFSGKARGELEFAEYLSKIENMSIFVMDYDHNSPSAKHLAETHEAFFSVIRKAHPELPVVIITKPDVDKNPEDSAKRRDVIRLTYEHAKAEGDKLVWFIDGFTLFGENGRAECTVDGTHPTALGFMRMAEHIYPVLKEIMDMM